MGKRLKVGTTIPAFCYDTPYEPQKAFYQLVSGEKPAFIVFLRNFGHPITRHYIMQYLDSVKALTSVNLVCVVQSQPQTIAAAVPKGALPFELICDADGVLYEYFDIPKTSSKLKGYSLQAVKIIREAQKQGYVAEKNEEHQLPLSLVVGNQGEVLFAHYGRSVTDLPADCYAIERVAQELSLQPKRQANWIETEDGYPQEPQEDGETEQENLEPVAVSVAVTDESQQEQTAAESFFEQDLQAPVQPMEQPQEPQQPQYKLEEVVHTSAQADYQKAGLPKGKIHYPQNRKPKALDFSELGFDTEE